MSEQRAIITWHGGNGPFEYIVRDGAVFMVQAPWVLVGFLADAREITYLAEVISG